MSQGTRNMIGKKVQVVDGMAILRSGRIVEVVDQKIVCGSLYIKVKIDNDTISDWKNIDRFNEFSEELYNIEIGDTVEVIKEDRYLSVGETFEVLSVEDNHEFIKISNGTTKYTSKFRKYKELSKEEIVEKVASKLALDLNGSNESKIRDRKSYLEDVQGDIGRYNRKLSDLYKKQRELMFEIETLKNQSNDNGSKYMNDLNAILEHEAVESIRPFNSGFVILTNRIDIYDKNGNKYRGGRYRLIVDFKHGTVYIEGRDEEYCRKSYWTDNDPHPHVDGDNGEACFGDAGSMISSAMGDEELYATFIVVYNFLQQANIDDPAGKYVKNWDCIDEDDNIIDNPMEDCYTECANCGCELTEEEYYTCYDCEEDFCGDHVRYVDSVGDYVCEECFDSYYGKCKVCDDWYRNEDLYKCEDCGSYVCEGHYQKSDGKIICEDCIDNKYIWCEHCQDYELVENTLCCDECGETFCKNCSNKNEKDGYSYCDDCFREIEEYEEEVEEDEE